jgi:hypothetical protein
MTAPLTALGPCRSARCDEPATVYVAPIHLARSPRVTIIAGERAAQLATGDGADLVRCVGCAMVVVEQIAGGVETREPVLAP